MPEFNDWFPTSKFGSESLNAKSFGAIGDGLSHTMTELGFANVAAANAGTGGNGIAYPKATQMSDQADWCGIQAAIDYALNPDNIATGTYGQGARIGNVFIPEGVYITNDTIHVGYGITNNVPGYDCVLVSGAGRNTVGGDSSGTVVKPNFLDRPCFNIQTSIGGGIRDIRMYGPVAPPTPAYNDLVGRANPANYVPAGAQDNQFSPFCGVCIDGYTGYDGLPPPIPYPTPRYPNWAQTTGGAYNKGFSTQVRIENCDIGYFVIGICQQPVNDSNADFTSAFKCNIFDCKIAFGIFNSQARNMNVSNCIIGAVHTAFQNNGYGHSVGNLQGTYDNISMSQVYRLIGSSSWSQPIVMNNIYGESAMILGDWENGALTIDGGVIAAAEVDLQLQTRGISSIIWAGGIATVTTALPLSGINDIGWTSGTRYVLLTTAPTSFGGGTWVEGTWVDDTHFTYAIANPGAAFTSGSFQVYYVAQWWNAPFYNCLNGNATFRNCRFDGRYFYLFTDKATFENCLFGGHTGYYGETAAIKPGARKASEAFSRLLMNMVDRNGSGCEVFSGTNSTLLGRGFTAREAQSGGWDGYNGYNLTSMWGRGQKDVGYGFDYDVPQMSRFGPGALGSISAVTGIERTGILDAAITRPEIGDVFYFKDHAWYSLEVIGGAGAVTVRQLTHFTMGTDGIYHSIDTDIGSAVYYYPIGILDLFPANNASTLAGSDGLFMKTAAGSPLITFVTYTGDVETAVARPTNLTVTSKPLWIGTSARYWANTTPFPAHTYILSFPDANGITMNKNALMSGTWAYGPGIKLFKLDTTITPAGTPVPFASLPSPSGSAEGQEYNITDGATVVWGANVTTGGGPYRIKVRSNGLNWTVVGK